MKHGTTGDGSKFARRGAGRSSLSNLQFVIFNFQFHAAQVSLPAAEMPEIASQAHDCVASA